MSRHSSLEWVRSLASLVMTMSKNVAANRFGDKSFLSVLSRPVHLLRQPVGRSVRTHLEETKHTANILQLLIVKLNNVAFRNYAVQQRLEKQYNA